jgi:predicted Zn-dependent peptidase
LDGEFRRYQLSQGARLYVRPTQKFKTVTVRVFLQQPLRVESVSLNALIPRVLRRGTVSCPSMRDLAVRLEELYGARLLSEVTKLGDRQVLVFGIDVVGASYLGGLRSAGDGPSLLDSGISLLNEVLTSPALRDGLFRQEVVEQEKDALSRQVRALINDKTQYSVVRCVEEMFKGEPFALHALGRLEGLKDVTPEGLFGHYSALFSESPADIFVVGDVDPADLKELLEGRLTFLARGPASVPSRPAGLVGHEPREIIEHEQVSQGKLTMGYRTGITLCEDEYYPLLMFEGILGAFPHSKLFTNVRERMSLAYYAQTTLDNSKGIMLIIAGVAPENYGKVVRTIKEQIELVREGEFSDFEIEATRRAIAHKIKSSEDSPSGQIAVFYERVLAGMPEPASLRLKKLEAVTREQVIKAAARAELDTIHFLSPPEARVEHSPGSKSQ